MPAGKAHCVQFVKAFVDPRENPLAGCWSTPTSFISTRKRFLVVGCENVTPLLIRPAHHRRTNNTTLQARGLPREDRGLPIVPWSVLRSESHMWCSSRCRKSTQGIRAGDPTVSRSLPAVCSRKARGSSAGVGRKGRIATG